MTDALRGEMQRIVDGSHAQFREALALGRKLSPEKLDAASTGQVWRAGEAVRLGLVDAVVPSLDGAFAAAGWTALLAGSPPKPESRVKTPYELRSF